MVKESKFIENPKGKFVHKVTFHPDFSTAEEYQRYLIEIGNEIAKSGKPFVIVTDGQGLHRIISKDES